MDLTSVARVRRHIGVPAADTSKDQKLSTIVEGVSRFIEGQCSRDFEYQEYTLKLSGDGKDELMLPMYPVHEITALTIEGATIDVESEIENEILDLDNGTGIVYRNYGWPAGKRNIVISFMAGYIFDVSESGLSAPELPDDLVLTATRLAARIYERSTAEGVANVSPSSYSVAYKDGLDPEMVAAIARYSRVRVG